MTAIELHLRIRLRPGEREAFLAFLHEAVPFYESPGEIRVRLLESSDDPDRFIELVEYATEEAFQQDRHRVEHDPVMKALLARWRALLAEPPAVEVYRVTPPATIRAR
jgi:quinol monooxygenase YgiN